MTGIRSTGFLFLPSGKRRSLLVHKCRSDGRAADGARAWLAACATSFLLLAAEAGPAQALELQRLEVQRDGAVYTLQVEARLDAPPERVFALLADPTQAGRINPSVRSVRLLPLPSPSTATSAVRSADGSLSSPAAADPRSEADGPALPPVRIAVESQSCFAAFCRTLHQVQRLHRRGAADGQGGEITAVTEPSPDGSFASGSAQLRVTAATANAIPRRGKESDGLRSEVPAASIGHSGNDAGSSVAATRLELVSRSEPNFWLPPLLRGWAVAQRLKQDTRIGLENLERLARAP